MRWIAVILVITACSPPPARPHAASPAGLVGLWGIETELAPTVDGELRVVGDRARIGGLAATLRDDHGELRARFEPSGHELRLRRDGDRLRGFWIQPRGTTLANGYATPITLARGGDAWVGEVKPLHDRLRMYLSIERGAAGYTAWIRETELNFGQRIGTLAIVEVAGQLEFRRGDGSVEFTGRLAGDQLAIHIAQESLDLTLTRRTRATAPGFYPRAPGHYVYRAPTATDDGWPVASIEDVGIDRARLIAVVEGIVAAVPTDVTSPGIHALVVARHGKLVVDDYFAGYAGDDTHDLRSAGKTLTTTLLGIASDRGVLGLDDPVVDILGAPVDAAPDARRAAVRVAHLASMQSGLDCDDNDARTPGNEDVMQNQRTVPDWYRYTWALPFVRAPGVKGVYCTGAINLIGAVLARKTGRWLPELFDAWIAAPLNITRYHWNLMPTGEGYMGGGARLRPRDLAKLAQLAVGRGSWRGAQVVSARWIDSATAAHASLDTDDDYGFGWWRRRYQIAGRSIDVTYASGNGAQLAIAAPALDLVIVINAGNYNYARVRRNILDTLVPALLAAAVPD